MSPIGWRWSFWIGLIISALILPIILLSPETFEPVLLKQKARQLQEQTGNYNIISPMELEKRDLKQIITIALARPIRMFVRESIVLFNSLYLALVFALFFLYFQTYPIIFHGMTSTLSQLRLNHRI
jgi:MFS family permease